MRNAKGFIASSILTTWLLAACTDRSASSANPEFDAVTSLEHFTPVGTAPMFAALPDGREIIAWVSTPDSSANGRLYISVGGSSPTEIIDTLGPIEAHSEAPPKISVSGDNTIHAIYVVGKEVPGRRFPLSALRYVRSDDAGHTWTHAQTITDDEVFGSHNFHALVADDSGRVVISWLDGRHGPGTSSAYVAVSRDNGASWSSNVRVDSTAACPCCRTSLAIGANGSLLLAWRSIIPGSIRDIVVARSTDDGRSWSTPVRVHADNWEFNGCPHAGPSLRTDRKGRVHIAWWTGKDSSAGVWYARSDDDARSFGEAVPLGVADFSRPAHAQLTVSGDTVLAVWDDGTRAVPRILFRRSIDAGRSFSPEVVLSDSSAHAAYPVLVSTIRGIAVAWTQLGMGAQSESHGPESMRIRWRR